MTSSSRTGTPCIHTHPLTCRLGCHVVAELLPGLCQLLGWCLDTQRQPLPLGTDPPDPELPGPRTWVSARGGWGDPRTVPCGSSQLTGCAFLPPGRTAAGGLRPELQQSRLPRVGPWPEAPKAPSHLPLDVLGVVTDCALGGSKISPLWKRKVSSCPGALSGMGRAVIRAQACLVPKSALFPGCHPDFIPQYPWLHPPPRPLGKWLKEQ